MEILNKKLLSFRVLFILAFGGVIASVFGQYHHSKKEVVDSLVQLKEYEKADYELLSHLTRNIDTEEKYYVYSHLGYIESIYNEQFDKSVVYYNKALDFAKKMNSKSKEVTMQANVANCYFMLGELDSAYNISSQSIILAREIKDTNSIIKLLNLKGLIGSSLTHYDEAIRHYIEAITYTKTSNNKYFRIALFNNLAGSFSKKKQIDSAYKYIEQSIDLCEEEESSYCKKSFRIYLDVLAEKEGVESAITLFNKKVTLKTLDDYNLYADFLLNKNQFQNVVNLLKNDSILEEEKDAHIRLNYFDMQYKACKGLENDSLALLFLERHIATYSGIYNPQEIREIEKLKNKVEREKLTARLTIQEKDNKLYRYQLFFILIIVVISAVVLSFLFIKIRRNITSYKEGQRELKEVVSKKDRELTELSLKISQKNTLLKNFNENLKDSFGINEAVDTELIILKKQINSILKVDNEWEEFHNYFINVNPNFYKKLLSQHESLSNKDLRLCSLVYLKLSNREIASLFNISEGSIKTAKHRLKKKLELPNETSFEAYFNQL